MKSRMKGSEGERWTEKKEEKTVFFFFLLISPRRHTELLPLDFLFYVITKAGPDQGEEN